MIFSKRTIRAISIPKLGRFRAAFGSQRRKTFKTVNFGQKMTKFWTQIAKFWRSQIFKFCPSQIFDDAADDDDDD